MKIYQCGGCGGGEGKGETCSGCGKPKEQCGCGK